jgi:hypothetical protein
MIKLVYLEFRLGVQFSCPCVKRGVLHSSSGGVFLKVDLKLRSVFKTKILELGFVVSTSFLYQINPASNTYLLT